MSTPSTDRVAEALRREWADEQLDAAARDRVNARIAAARTRRWRRMILAPAIVVALAVAAVLVSSVAVDDALRASEVRQRAGAAVDPGRDVLHYLASVRQTRVGHGGADLELELEAWLYPSRDRSRTIVRESGEVRTEIVTTPTETTVWSPREGKEPQRFGPRPPSDPQAEGAAGIPPITATTLEQIRAALPQGTVKGPLTDAPTGREVYEIETIERHPTEVGKWRMNYRVDAATFAPVRLVRTMLEARPEFVSPRPGDTVTTDFSVVERLSPEEGAPKLRHTSP